MISELDDCSPFERGGRRKEMERGGEGEEEVEGGKKGRVKREE
jgi:hypothetical protein